MWKSLNEVLDKYERWKNATERKGLRVNFDKTKGMHLLFGKKSSFSKVDPCGVCGERVGFNSIKCAKYPSWVRRHYSDVPRNVSLLSVMSGYLCITCLGYNCSVEEKLKEVNIF